MIRRAQHWTDIPVSGKQRRRKISNWANYQEPGKGWSVSDPSVDLATGTPDNWGSGAFDFRRYSLRGPLQIFVGDSTTPRTTALAGVRKADNPGAWMNFKMLGGDPNVEMEDLPAQRAVLWRDLWPQTDLLYRIGGSILHEDFVLKKHGHPSGFRFALKIPPGYSYDIVNSSIRLIDGNGVEQLRTAPPWGHDSSTVHPGSMDGTKPVRVTLAEAAPITVGQRVLPTFRLVPDQDDLDTAVYPVTIDPTTPITGTTDVEDAFLLVPPWQTLNYGGDDRAIVRHPGAVDEIRQLVRIATIGAIPAGTIIGLTLYMHATSGTGTDIAAYVIKDANDWVEGTGAGQSQAGTSCWDFAKNSGQAWAGSTGCKTSGTDYDADGSPPTHTTTAGWNAFVLDPDWATAWRDATRLSNGVVISAVVAAAIFFKSSEHASFPLYFEVDYTPAGGTAQRYFFMGG